MSEMNDQKPEKMEKPEELVRAEKLIDDAKVNEAHELLNNFERNKELTLHDKVASHNLRADLLYQQSRYEEVLTLAEQTYKESLGLGKNILSVDALIWMALALFLAGKFDKVLDVIIQGEELLKALSQELPVDYQRREAFLDFIKGGFYAMTGEIVLAVPPTMKSLDLSEKTDFKKLSATILAILALFTISIRDLDVAFGYIKKGLAIAKESKNKFAISQCLLVLGEIHSHKGDWERALKIYKKVRGWSKICYKKNGDFSL